MISKMSKQFWQNSYRFLHIMIAVAAVIITTTLIILFDTGTDKFIFFMKNSTIGISISIACCLWVAIVIIGLFIIFTKRALRGDV